MGAGAIRIDLSEALGAEIKGSVKPDFEWIIHILISAEGDREILAIKVEVIGAIGVAHKRIHPEQGTYTSIAR